MGTRNDLGLHLIFTSFFLLATTYTCLSVENTSIICFEQERLALLKFKHSVKDFSGMLSSWIGKDCCRWEGIQCDSLTGRVESLNLHFVVGNEVNSSLVELRHLNHLDLSENDFRGSRIPEFIGSFKQMTYLNLSNAGFRGIIPPHIGNLSNLKVLDLSLNYYLMSDDMSWTFGLLSLQHLNLSDVDLGGAKNMGMVLYNLPSLKELSLRGCGLSNLGPFLNSSRTLPNIKHLDLSFNSFTGPLPGFFQNLTSLTFLDLSNFDLSLAWNFADFLKMIPSLTELHMSHCELNKTFLSSPHLNLSTISNIQHLDLSDNSIGGIFPSILTNMTSLRFLYLSGNMLSSSVSTMPNLLELDLSNNRLTGPIPESLRRLRFLEVLDLSYNEFTGPIPTFFGKLSKLDLSFNQLNGSIPDFFGKLTDLTDLNLGSNQLRGAIPVSVGKLSKLHALDISYNSLEGVVSEAHFANLSMLKHLDTSYNTKLTFKVSREWIPPFQLVSFKIISCNIGSEFPQWLQNQRTLETLVLSNASISGPLPTWLREMPVIPFLDLSHNKLSGSLTNLPNGGNFYVSGYRVDRVLSLEDNLFNESIPRSLCRRTDLEILDLSRNRLTGKIPKCLQNLQQLFAMIFSTNQLSGFIPSFIAFNSSSLVWLQLNDNNFVGEVPRELGKLRNLSVLDLGDNNFSGNIPDWIGENLLSLMVLRLHKNHFTGKIPLSLCKCSKLHILDVAYNNLTGTIPACLGNLDAMASKLSESAHVYERVIQVIKGVDLEYTTTWDIVYNMDLSSNKLVGEIPVEITALSMLLGLNLSNNHLSGRIPENIGNMMRLESLDLSGNKLTGMIPSSMAALTFLSHLNLSHNNLWGRIPTGHQLQTLIDDPSIYAGNRDLCGPPLTKDCSKHEDQTTTITMPKKKYKQTDAPTKAWLKTWYYVDVTCGFATGFWGVIGLLLLMKQWRQKLFTFVEETIENIS
ncbi:unnamed protein product [Lactuca saligna]|uniref:Leucine-rich repeat-containing N-terminal plant-type domain-containing protein n=1 Tax=Lactuca saligna TaxID=75948 RepID=A0AA36EJU1_LACSI|nr:unnamed protein product [Lactuca saligna]